MTSKHEVGQEVHIPFWLVLDLLDSFQGHAFVRGKITSLYTIDAAGPAGPIVLEVADIDLGNDLLAKTVHRENILQTSELEEWTKNIAAWFMAYPESLKQASQN
jgi:hypothetical protein